MYVIEYEERAYFVVNLILQYKQLKLSTVYYELYNYMIFNWL